MIIERRQHPRPTKASPPPLIRLVITPWLSFAHVNTGGRMRLIPGATLATAQSNAIAYLSGRGQL